MKAGFGSDSPKARETPPKDTVECASLPFAIEPASLPFSIVVFAIIAFVMSPVESVVIIVPPLSGKFIILSAVGSMTPRVVLWLSEVVAPSKIIVPSVPPSVTLLN